MSTLYLVSLLSFSWSGAVTVYAADEWAGLPLYCDQRWRGIGDYAALTYSEDMPPWIALPVETFELGYAQCGDLCHVQTEDGHSFLALALDAGPFAGYQIADLDYAPILADVPEYHWPYDDGRLSVRATLTNYSALWRATQGLAQ